MPNTKRAWPPPGMSYRESAPLMREAALTQRSATREDQKRGSEVPCQASMHNGITHKQIRKEEKEGRGIDSALCHMSLKRGNQSEASYDASMKEGVNTQ
eukprot:scaffold190853_cov17-Tisochrysis_lutea.AAC.1